MSVVWPQLVNSTPNLIHIVYVLLYTGDFPLGIIGREGRKECLLCDAECESVSHVLWDCPAYASVRSAFMLELRRELGR